MTNDPQGLTADQDRTPVRILGVSGSLRKASFNTGLLRAAQAAAPDWVEIEIYDI